MNEKALVHIILCRSFDVNIQCPSSSLDTIDTIQLPLEQICVCFL